MSRKTGKGNFYDTNLFLTGWIVFGILFFFTRLAGAFEIRTYEITCDPNEYAYIIAHPHEDRYIDCEFEYNGRLWQDVRIRIRGESSRNYPKKSFKVNFPSEDRFFGRDKLNLISEYTDATFSREHLAYDMFHRSGLNASSTWFTRLMINGQFAGLYLDVENVDEHYLDRIDIDDNASIYKADLPRAMLTTFEDVETLWEKNTNTDTDFYDLHNLIEWIDKVDDDNFYSELAERFDRDELARSIAVNTLIANVSTYYHNYYLIHDIEENGKWHYLPWDMDLTFLYSNHGSYPPMDRSGHQLFYYTNALVRRCWLNTDFRDVIFDHLTGITDSIFTDDYLNAMTDSISTFLPDDLERDTLFNYSMDEFTEGIQVLNSRARERRRTVRDLIERAGYSFDLHEPVIISDGAILSWDVSEYAGGVIENYRVQISTDSMLRAETTDYFTNQPYLVVGDLEPGSYFWQVNAISPANIYTPSISPFAHLHIPEGIHDGIEVTGSMAESTVWTIDDSPVRIVGELIIPEDVTLRIEAGVHIGMEANSILRVNGGLTINGVADDSVYFVSNDPTTNWGGIIINNPSASSSIRHTKFQDVNGAVNELGLSGAIQVDSGELTVANCLFSNGESGGIVAINSEITVTRTKFTNFHEDIVHHIGGHLLIRDCDFVSNRSDQDMDLVDVEDCENV